MVKFLINKYREDKGQKKFTQLILIHNTYLTPQNILYECCVMLLCHFICVSFCAQDFIEKHTILGVVSYVSRTHLGILGYYTDYRKKNGSMDGTMYGLI